MKVLYATDENGLWSYELSRAVLKKAIPDAEVVLFTDFDGSSDDATVVNVSKYLEESGIAGLWYSGPYRFPPMSAARLVAPLVPETNGSDRILYLDTDTLVLDGDAVRRFYDIPFDPDSDCVGCRDEVAPLFLSLNNGRMTKLLNALLESGAIAGHDQTIVGNMMKNLYINTGVVLYNMERLAGAGYGEILGCVRSILKNHRFKFLDQDATNILLSTQEAPTRFNDLVAGHGMVPYKDTAIAHYAGGRRAKAAFREAAERLLYTSPR